MAIVQHCVLVACIQAACTGIAVGLGSLGPHCTACLLDISCSVSCRLVFFMCLLCMHRTSSTSVPCGSSALQSAIEWGLSSQTLEGGNLKLEARGCYQLSFKGKARLYPSQPCTALCNVTASTAEQWLGRSPSTKAGRTAKHTQCCWRWSLS